MQEAGSWDQIQQDTLARLQCARPVSYTHLMAFGLADFCGTFGDGNCCHHHTAMICSPKPFRSPLFKTATVSVLE